MDQGYGNIKTANHCFPTGISGSDTEPLFTADMLVYEGRYYLIGEGHKEFMPDKVMDDDYYLLTLAAIARELADEQLTEASVFLAVGLPLTWTAGQKEALAAYLSRNEEIRFTYRKVDYRIRLDRLGFTYEAIQEKIRANLYDPSALYGRNSNLPYRPKRFPLLELERNLGYEIEHSHDTATVLVDAVFFIILQIVKLARGEQEGEVSFQPLSPSIRAELARFDQLHAEYMLLSGHDIHTADELFRFVAETEQHIRALEQERQNCRNQLRRPKPKETEDELKQKIAETTEEIAPLRNDLAAARRISERWRRYYELLQAFSYKLKMKAMKHQGRTSD